MKALKVIRQLQVNQLKAQEPLHLLDCKLNAFSDTCVLTCAGMGFQQSFKRGLPLRWSACPAVLPGRPPC